MSFDLDSLVRENIKSLSPYSTARDEFSGFASVYLDANENAYGSAVKGSYNRYPDPKQILLKNELAAIKPVSQENIIIGNGSDELIDLAFRIFCEPGKDNVIVCPPTYGMYAVCAKINQVEIKEVPLTVRYQLDMENIFSSVNDRTKIIFVCSPNNPSGNVMNAADLTRLCNNFKGIVFLDEAYIDFADDESFLQNLISLPNLFIIQTMSKAWGMAALRLGIGYASAQMIEVFNKVKPPYNINQYSQEMAIEALQHTNVITEWIEKIKESREKLVSELKQFLFVETIYPSSANFILVKVKNADELYAYLLQKGIIVRNRSSIKESSQCLRITIGTEKENKTLLDALKNY